MERRKEERMTDTINCKEDKALITSGISRWVKNDFLQF
jgi:hypothetical protein